MNTEIHMCTVVLILLRDCTIAIILVMFETNLKICTENICTVNYIQ